MWAKRLLIMSLALFSLIVIVGVIKQKEKRVQQSQPQEVVASATLGSQEAYIPSKTVEQLDFTSDKWPLASSHLPEANRVDELFNPYGLKLPIVETIQYSSRVPWLVGRSAWIADYSAHYDTSKHFIARSLSGGDPNYFRHEVNQGDRFNVLRKDKPFEFYLLVDLSRSKLWFYCLEKDRNVRTLIKTYQVGLGRLDKSSPSGSLTPMGRYSLGSRVAVYKPGMMGIFRRNNVEMMQIFGTRWIPFEKEMGAVSAPAKGYGIHGLPWDETASGLVENLSSLGGYESDGCIRLKKDDIEELFSIIITRPTTIEIVRDFEDAELPGIELESSLGAALDTEELEEMDNKIFEDVT